MRTGEASKNNTEEKRDLGGLNLDCLFVWIRINELIICKSVVRIIRTG